MSDLALQLNQHTLWKRAISCCEQWTREDQIPALSLMVGTASETAGPFSFGRLKIDTPASQSGSLDREPLFLTASITKPIVAMGILRLIEQGELLLGTKVSDIVPEFGRTGAYGVTIRHLLTHSSGLPDMLPDNRELRQNHAPLSAFVAGACQVPFAFPTGREASYSSMGYALLGEILERLTGQSTSQYLHENIFMPLGMKQTALGVPSDWLSGDDPLIDRVAEIRVPEAWDPGVESNWNSSYWRSLGAPWGGVISTASDLSRFVRMMIGKGRFEGQRILSRQAVKIATCNQLEFLKEIPAQTRRCRAWGLGWRRHWPAHSASFGDLLGSQSYGHWGATGTVMWIDPEAEIWAIILTSEPQEPQGKLLARLSNLVSASLSDLPD